MRLLIIGRLSGELVLASKIAMSRGASVTQADTIEQGLSVLRAKGADLIMIDVGLSVRDLVAALEVERIRTPVIACGTGTDARAAVAAIQAGAKEYVPLPPDPELIAAVLEAVSRGPVSSGPQTGVAWRKPFWGIRHGCWRNCAERAAWSRTGARFRSHRPPAPASRHRRHRIRRDRIRPGHPFCPARHSGGSGQGVNRPLSVRTRRPERRARHHQPGCDRHRKPETIDRRGTPHAVSLGALRRSRHQRRRR